MTAFRLASRYTALLLTVLTAASLIGLGPAVAAGPTAGLGGSPAGLSGPPGGFGEVPVLTAPNAYGPGIWHHAKAGKTWYGAYRTFPETSAYCIDAGKKSPLPKYFTGAKADQVTSALTAWALHEYAGSDSKDVQAALSAMARLDEALPHDHQVPAQKPAELGKKFAKAAKQHARILAKAKKYAGPYTLDISLEPVLQIPKVEPYADTQSATSQEPDSSDSGPHDSGAHDAPDEGAVLGIPTDEATLTISLTSASGAQVPDIPISLDVDGADGPPETLTTGSEAMTTTLRASAPGNLSVSASAKVAPETVRLFEPTKGTRVQRVITPDSPVTVTGDASLDLSSHPKVTTEISNQAPAPGSTVTDEFTVSGLLGDHTVSVEHTLWQTAAEPKLGTKNQDARAIGSVTSKDVGNGTHTSEEIRVPEDFRGWLYFTETIAGDDKTREWRGIHGQPRETGFVPWTPKADTEAVLEGTSTHDEVTVTGLQPGSEAVVTVTAYHSTHEPEQSPKPQGEALSEQDFTVIADADGHAEISTEAIDMPIGWVSYVTAIDGSDVNEAWTSDWGVPAETVHRPPEDKPSSPPAPPEEPSSPPESPAPSEQPSPPEEGPSSPPSPPEEEPSSPPEEPEAPEHPEAPETPEAEPVAETPPTPSAELPRTGATGTGKLIGLSIVLVGLGTTVLLITGRGRDNS